MLSLIKVYCYLSGLYAREDLFTEIPYIIKLYVKGEEGEVTLHPISKDKKFVLTPTRREVNGEKGGRNHYSIK